MAGVLPVTALGKLLTCMSLCHQQYNLVLGRWVVMLLNWVTIVLAETNGRLPLDEWLKVTCGLTACIPGSAPGLTLGNEYGRTLPLSF